MLSWMPSTTSLGRSRPVSCSPTVAPDRGSEADQKTRGVTNRMNHNT